MSDDDSCLSVAEFRVADDSVHRRRSADSGNHRAASESVRSQRDQCLPRDARLLAGDDQSSGTGGVRRRHAAGARRLRRGLPASKLRHAGDTDHRAHWTARLTARAPSAS